MTQTKQPLAILDEQEVVSEPRAETRRQGEWPNLVADSFSLPVRNWESIIHNFNVNNTKPFPLTAKQCKVIVEFVKRGQMPKVIFQSLGFPTARYSKFLNAAADMEAKLEELTSKMTLTDKELQLANGLAIHPLRILFSDIERAYGIASLCDWELFNNEARVNAPLLVEKMKQKFKDSFGNDSDQSKNINVQINVGGDWIDNL